MLVSVDRLNQNGGHNCTRSAKKKCIVSPNQLSWKRANGSQYSHSVHFYERNVVVPSLVTVSGLYPILSWIFEILLGSLSGMGESSSKLCPLPASSSFFISFVHSFFAFSYSSTSSPLNSILVGFLRSMIFKKLSAKFQVKLVKMKNGGKTVSWATDIASQQNSSKQGAYFMYGKEFKMAAFERHKLACLSQVDLSKKGSIDDQILDLVHCINSKDNYFTTSSCSGRVSVFSEVSRLNSALQLMRFKLNWLNAFHSYMKSHACFISEWWFTWDQHGLSTTKLTGKTQTHW